MFHVAHNCFLFFGDEEFDRRLDPCVFILASLELRL